MREEQQIPSRSKVNYDDEDEAVGWIRENDDNMDFNYDDADMDGWGEVDTSPQLIVLNSTNSNFSNGMMKIDSAEVKVLDQSQIIK